MNESEIRVAAKAIYIAMVVAFLVTIIFALFFKDEVIFIYYGYDPQLIHSSEFEAFEAYRVTYPARRNTFVFAIVISALCFAASLFAKSVGLDPKYLVYIILFVSLTVFIYLSFIALLSATIPTRVV